MCVEVRQIRNEKKLQAVLESKENFSREQLIFPIRKASETIKVSISRALFLHYGWSKYVGALHLLETE